MSIPGDFGRLDDEDLNRLADHMPTLSLRSPLMMAMEAAARSLHIMPRLEQEVVDAEAQRSGASQEHVHYGDSGYETPKSYVPPRPHLLPDDLPELMVRTHRPSRFMQTYQLVLRTEAEEISLKINGYLHPQNEALVLPLITLDVFKRGPVPVNEHRVHRLVWRDHHVLSADHDPQLNDLLGRIERAIYQRQEIFRNLIARKLLIEQSQIPTKRS